MSQPSQRGYPLGALFVLVTASATIIAGLAPVLRGFGDDGPDTATVLISVGLGFFAGGAIGAVMGLYQYRWVVGASLGIICGTIVGVVAGLLALAPARIMPSVAIAFMVGSGLMIGIALVMRQSRG
jgi:hypothetical protein